MKNNERPDNRRTLQRRHFVAGLAGALALPAAAAAARTARPVAGTPAQTLGPFYPRDAGERPDDTDADLLQVRDGRVLTRGVPLYLTGKVLDRRGGPVAEAAVEIWQCDANAVYHHPDGGPESARDPNFQGYGVARTGSDGSFHFRTIRPVAYPGRTPHIHVRVQPAGARSFATQLYLPDEPANRRDFLFARLSAEEQAALTLKIGPTPASEAHPMARLTQQTARTELLLA